MAYDPWAYTFPYGVLNRGALIFEVGVLATLRLRGRPGQDSRQVHGGRIFNMAANLFPKTVPQCTLTIISTRSSAQPRSGE